MRINRYEFGVDNGGFLDWQLIGVVCLLGFVLVGCWVLMLGLVCARIFWLL